LGDLHPLGGMSGYVWPIRLTRRSLTKSNCQEPRTPLYQCPVAIEKPAPGGWNHKAVEWLQELGRRMTAVTMKTLGKQLTCSSVCQWLSNEEMQSYSTTHSPPTKRRCGLKTCLVFDVLLSGLEYHHHRDAKRSAGASRRCDHSPEQSVLRWLQGLSRRYTYTRVAAHRTSSSNNQTRSQSDHPFQRYHHLNIPRWQKFEGQVTPLIEHGFTSAPTQYRLYGRRWGQMRTNINKKAVLPQGNHATPQVFFSVEVRQQHSLQV